MRYGYGVDVGGTTIKLAYFDETGNMLEKWEIPTNTANGGSAILPDIAAAVAAHIAKTGTAREQLVGIGLGVPGPVLRDGTVNKCINLGWGVFNVEKALSDLTGLSVAAGNDANMAALGEDWKGSGDGCENMVMATFGTGVGGGIIMDGRVLSGVHGSGGEIGHLVVNLHETEYCNCGKKGCVEQYCSATGIVRMAKQFMEKYDVPSTLRILDPLTCKDVFACSEQGDMLASFVLEHVYEYMGMFLSAVCCVVDPEVVVLGGGVSKAGKPLLEGAKRQFDRHVFHAAKDVRFALASLGNDAGAYGAFKLVLDKYG